MSNCTTFDQIVSAGFAYIVPFICFTGVIVNGFNIFVFSQKSLRHFSLYNLTLALAVCDALALLLVLPACVFRCKCSEVGCQTLALPVAEILAWYDANFLFPIKNSLTLASMWLVVVISVDRLVFVKFYLNKHCSPSFQKPVLARFFAILVCLVSFLFHVPLYFAREVHESTEIVITKIGDDTSYHRYSWFRLLLGQILPSSVLVVIYIILRLHLRRPRKIVGHGAHISLYYYKINVLVTQMVCRMIIIFILFDMQSGFFTNRVVAKKIFPNNEVYMLMQFLGDTLEVTGNVVNFFIYYKYNKAFKYELKLMWRHCLIRVRGNQIAPRPIVTGIFSVSRISHQ